MGEPPEQDTRARSALPHVLDRPVSRCSGEVLVPEREETFEERRRRIAAMPGPPIDVQPSRRDRLRQEREIQAADLDAIEALLPPTRMWARESDLPPRWVLVCEHPDHPGVAPDAFEVVTMASGARDVLQAAARMPEVIAYARRLEAELAAAIRDRNDAQRASAGLYHAILDRLRAHFPADSRDLDWDVLPSTVAGLARERDEARAERDRLAMALRCARGDW